MRKLGIALKVAGGILSIPVLTLPLVAWIDSIPRGAHFRWESWNWIGLIIILILCSVGILICDKYKGIKEDATSRD